MSLSPHMATCTDPSSSPRSPVKFKIGRADNGETIQCFVFIDIGEAFDSKNPDHSSTKSVPTVSIVQHANSSKIPQLTGNRTQFVCLGGVALLKSSTLLGVE